MFKTEYIYELTSGQLSNEGYKHLINTIASFIKKYNWQKFILGSNQVNSNSFWSSDEVKELTHQFLEWSLGKRKFEHLNKIPESYLSYYFSQILISFVANRIKEEQQKEGLSFEKCRELVISICNKDYIIKGFAGNDFVFRNAFSQNEVKPPEDFQEAISYLPKIPIKESTKHFSPLVKLAIEDIFNIIEAPIQISKLIEAVYKLFDQKGFNKGDLVEEASFELEMGMTSLKYMKIIQSILTGMTKEDAIMISHFLFHNEKNDSLAEMASYYNVPKSTLHYKTESFKRKIAYNYKPENEEDGVCFIQNIARSLDEFAK